MKKKLLILASILICSSCSSETAVSITEDTTLSLTTLKETELSYMGYDGEPLDFEKADMTQEPYIVFPYTFGYFNDEVIRIDVGEDINGFYVDAAGYVLHNSDGELYEFSGGYRFSDKVSLYGTLYFDVPYMSHDAEYIMLAVNMEDNTHIPFPYHDGTIQRELRINLGNKEDYAENETVRKLIDNKEIYDEHSLYVTLTDFNITWSNVLWNQSTAVISDYKSDETDFSCLIPELGYDICDKSSEDYLYAKKSCEEGCSREELAEYEKRNYFEEIVFHPYYLGTEQADWFVEAWWFYGGSEVSSYIDFLIIKDDEIVRRTGALPIRGTINEKWDKKDFFRPAGKDGVVRYNFETGEIEYIGDEFVTTDIADQTRVLDLNDSYALVYIFEHLYIYDRNTRECMDTGLDFYAMTMARARLEDDKIYWQDNRGENKLIYYIKTGEIVYDDSISVEFAC